MKSQQKDKRKPTISLIPAKSIICKQKSGHSFEVTADQMICQLENFLDFSEVQKPAPEFSMPHIVWKECFK